MKTIQEKPILVKIADQLLKDQQSLDDLVVQFSLGKAEVKEKFQILKHNLKDNLHDFQVKLDTEIEEEINEVIDSIMILDHQLNEAEANTKEEFLTQKKNILEKIEVVKVQIKNNPNVLKVEDYFTNTLQNAKIRMVILEKNLDNKKTAITEEYHHEMNLAKERINAMISRINKMEEDTSHKWDNFSDELTISYEHLRKAINAL